jgi:hypothetical protein
VSPEKSNRIQLHRERMVRSRAHQTELLVLSIISMHDGGAPDHCYASAACIAAQANTTRPAVSRCIRRLVEAGEIEVMGKRRNRGKGAQPTLRIRIRDEVLLAREPRWNFGQGGKGVTTVVTPSRCYHSDNTTSKVLPQCNTKEHSPEEIPKGISSVESGAGSSRRFRHSGTEMDGRVMPKAPPPAASSSRSKASPLPPPSSAHHEDEDAIREWEGAAL